MMTSGPKLVRLKSEAAVAAAEGRMMFCTMV